MNMISTILLSVAALGLGYTVLAWLTFFMAKRKHQTVIDLAFAPAVSIFKPLKGLDESLRDNLESFFRIDYPRYELIFGVNDVNDPAIAVVEELRRRYPDIPATLVVDTHRQGFNPKVNNLCNMTAHASFDYWVISDSNVHVNRDYLTRFVQSMRDTKVGLVTSLIRGVGGRRLGAKLENLHLNSFIAASTIAVSRLSRIPVTIGKSMLIRRQTIERLGGFEAFANYLLEDGLLGRQVRDLGLMTETSLDAIENINDTWSVRNFMSRHFRWALMRKKLNVGHYLLEILSSPIVTTLAAIIISPSIETLTLGSAILAAKVVFDLATIRLTGGAIHPISILLLPMKDLLIGVLWAAPFFTDKVTWRGNRFRVGAMTSIIPLNQPVQPVLSWSRNVQESIASIYRYTRERFSLQSSEA